MYVGGDIAGLVNATHRMLFMIDLAKFVLARCDPAGVDAVNPHRGPQANGKRMGQRDDPAFAGRVSLRLGGSGCSARVEAMLMIATPGRWRMKDRACLAQRK